MLTAFEVDRENALLTEFKQRNPELFRQNDAQLARHLITVLALLALSTAAVIAVPWVTVKILLGPVNAFLIFSLINVTIHHHHTHKNTSKNPKVRRLLDLLYLLVMPNAPKRLNRYVRAHLNHHARPFHETDVDHHYGLVRYGRMMKSFIGKLLYFADLTFVGMHVPGWEDDSYMNNVPLENWNRRDYEDVMKKERKRAVFTALWQWAGFFALLFLFPPLAWAWVYPMLLVKNWAHFLGQFQHHDVRLLDPERSVFNRTKSFRVPGWLNYLSGGEISGHFLHHIYPEMPYYNVEKARRRFSADPLLSKAFVTY